MKKSFGILLSCLLLLISGVTASFMTNVDMTHVVEGLSDNIGGLIIAAAPTAIITSSITPEMLQDWKLKFGKIKIITVVVEDEEKDKDGNVVNEGEKYQFVVRRPDKGLINMLLPLAERREIDQFAEKGIKNLIVGGDMEALEDGLVYMGVVSKLQKMIAPAASFLGNA